jgi:hypothetical protein
MPIPIRIGLDFSFSAAAVFVAQQQVGLRAGDRFGVTLLLQFAGDRRANLAVDDGHGLTRRFGGLARIPGESLEGREVRLWIPHRVRLRWCRSTPSGEQRRSQCED